MEQVAELLGVELDEEFKIEGCENVTKYKLTLDGMYYYSEYDKAWKSSHSIYYEILAGKREVIKLPKQVLTEKEKEYLSGVIKPFRNEVKYVVKDCDEFGQYISISMQIGPSITVSIHDPEIDYIGMEARKEYELEELGL